jgi:acetyl esterase
MIRFALLWIPLASLAAAGLPEVVYSRAGGVELRMDIAVPEGAGPFPAVVCLHGGGWSMGSKKSFHPALREFVAQGMVAATAQYRLAPAVRFPAQLDDVRAAVRFLRAHAAEWKIDPARVSLLGASAGGHLALLAAFRQAGGPDAVEKVISISGPTDLRDWRMGPGPEENLRKTVGKSGSDLLADLLGESDRSAPIYATASPVAQVRPGLPPVLLFHWKDDQAVAAEQAARLAARLAKAGVPCQAVWFEGRGHALFGPGVERIVPETVRFLLGRP